MKALTLPVEDWDSLLSLAFGAAVAQVGYTDGSDTVRLARAASMVMAVPPDHRAIGTELGPVFEVWDAAVTAADIRGRVIGTVLPFTMVLTLWPPDTFGLAVINPEMVEPGSLAMALELAVCCARRVVVIDPDHTVVIDTLLDQAVPDIPTATVRSGSLWVINAMAADHAITGVI